LQELTVNTPGQDENKIQQNRDQNYMIIYPLILVKTSVDDELDHTQGQASTRFGSICIIYQSLIM